MQTNPRVAFGLFSWLTFVMGQALPKVLPVPVDRFGFSGWRGMDGHRKDEGKRTLQSACVHEFDHFMAGLSPCAVQGRWKSTKEMTWSSVPVSSKALKLCCISFASSVPQSFSNPVQEHAEQPVPCARMCCLVRRWQICDQEFVTMPTVQLEISSQAGNQGESNLPARNI